MGTPVKIVPKPWPILNYVIDRTHGILWIIHRKCAGSSIRKALNVRRMDARVDALRYKDYHTITVVRHPWERLTSAYHNPYNAPATFHEWAHWEILSHRSIPQKIDWHMWPYWIPLEDFRLDRIILMEDLDEEWKKLQGEYQLPALERVNASENGHNWRTPDGTPFNWSMLLPVYERDFGLCEDWRKSSDSSWRGDPGLQAGEERPLAWWAYKG